MNITFTTLRALKGTPITLLLALAINRAPASQRWLSMTLGYDRKTVRKALGFLQQDGYVERSGHDQWRLAVLPHVTLEYVTAHMAQARQEGPRTKTGLLIHRIRHADPMPDLCDRCTRVGGDHAADCPSHPDNDRRRYVTGQYADLIEY
jgi:hypothetical protein